ncbi:hypothetical protein FD755_018425, partial [Muntiacus reevesi]
QNVPCDLGYFPCGNTTTCLPQQLQCNGVDDCENHVDEDNCVVGSAPMQCICQGLELECDEINLRAVPSVSSNVTFIIFDAFELQYWRRLLKVP